MFRANEKAHVVVKICLLKILLQVKNASKDKSKSGSVKWHLVTQKLDGFQIEFLSQTVVGNLHRRVSDHGVHLTETFDI